MVTQTLKDCSLCRILLLELSWRTTTTCHLAISYVNCTGYLFNLELSSRKPASHTKYLPPATQPTWALCLITIHLYVLYVQLISTSCSTHGFLLSLPRCSLVTSHLNFGTKYPSISGFALPYQPSNVISKRTYLNSILHFTPAILLT